jgi:exopolysaccharide production protein ExoZ
MASIDRVETGTRRIESLDYLRGLMALAVMIYHYASWHTATPPDSRTLLGKLGIYAVAVFYILSGLSLTIVYRDKVVALGDLWPFYIKRVFRIFPLFYLAVTSMLVLRSGYGHLSGADLSSSAYAIFLNYSLLFGFVEPSASIPTGGWSIGNEMVFYAVLPFVFLLSRKSKFIVPMCFLVSVILGLNWAFFLIDTSLSLRDQWKLYVNPMNQISFFMAGVLIGVYGPLLKDKIPKPAGVFMLLSAVTLFWLYPVSGNLVSVVTGTSRVILSACCMFCVLFVFVINPQFKPLLGKPLAFFGECCYSIYLLHPIVAAPVFVVFHRLNLDNYRLKASLVSVCLTLAASWVSFNFIEKPMMKVGKDISEKARTRGASLKTDRIRE